MELTKGQERKIQRIRNKLDKIEELSHDAGLLADEIFGSDSKAACEIGSIACTAGDCGAFLDEAVEALENAEE